MATVHSKPGEGQHEVEQIKSCIEKRLFIGRLPPGTDENEIQQVFGARGHLTECKVVDGKSCAFVRYETWGAAHRALLQFDGKSPFMACTGPVVVSFAETKSAGFGGGKRFAKGQERSQLLVGELPKDVGDQDLVELFGSFGEVHDVKLLHSPGSCSALVRLSLWGEAVDAIETLDNSTVVEAWPLLAVNFSEAAPVSTVALAEWHPPKRQRVEDRSSDDYRAEFESLVKDYAQTMDSSAPAASVEKIHQRLMFLRGFAARGQTWGHSGQTWESSGSSNFVATWAGASSPGSTWGDSSSGAGQTGFGGSFYGACATSNDAMANYTDDNNRLFIGGLPRECTDEDLRALIEQLQQANEIPPTELQECRTLAGKCCGYLKFPSHSIAVAAFTALDNRSVNGWPEVVRTKWAEPGRREQAAMVAVGVPGGKGWGCGDGISAGKGWGCGDTFSAPKPIRAASTAGMQPGTLAEKIHQRLVSRYGSSPQSALPGTNSMVSFSDENTRLFIGGLPRECADEDLKSLIEQLQMANELPMVEILECRTLPGKCCGYLKFPTHSAAQAAFQALNDRWVNGWPGMLRAKWADQGKGK